MKRLLVIPAMLATLAIASTATADDHGKNHEARAAQFKEKLAGIPEDKQQMILDSFKSGREDGKTSWKEMKAKHEELRALSIAPEFNRDAYLAKSAEISALKGEMQAKRAERKADLLSKLTAEERKILADAKGKRHGKRGKHQANDGADRE